MGVIQVAVAEATADCSAAEIPAAAFYGSWFSCVSVVMETDAATVDLADAATTAVS